MICDTLCGSQLVWHRDPPSLVTDKPLHKSQKMFNFSNVFNGKMLQFEPETALNITVCQRKKV